MNENYNPSDFGTGFNKHYHENAELYNPIDLWITETRIAKMRGRVLTVVEAALAGDDRLKPVKDLLHAEFNRLSGEFHELAYEGSEMQKQDVTSHDPKEAEKHGIDSKDLMSECCSADVDIAPVVTASTASSGEMWVCTNCGEATTALLRSK